uniref:LIM zinc-binding domain-containing protein n=1 Tax=Manihot esculenta TaxID=3983 RepID=A0A2C9VKP4_MANES
MAPPSSSSSSSGVNHISNPCIYERKSRFMKWLSKIFKSGSSHGGGGGGGGSRQPQLEENMVSWRPPARSLDEHSRADKQKEKADHAVALSQAEDWKRPGYRCRTDNDEDLDRALHDSLNPPGYRPLAPSYAPLQYYNIGCRLLCGGCHRDIGYGNYLGCMGKFFHPECFRCSSCGYPITEDEFSLSGSDPYHKSCFKELTHPKCEVCLQYIPTNEVGLIEYRCHPFWSQKYCPSHEHDNTARCCSCERLESWDTRHYSLEDGRSLCLACMESAIMDTGDCQPLYHAIRDYYEGMNMKLDQQIPMLLVERQALNEAIVGEKNLACDLLLYHIQRRPRIGGNRLVGIRTQPQKVTRKSCEVTAILVLYGLPRLLTGAILAHELMHGWLRLKGYRHLNPEVEEGICQVLSYMWLESEVLPSKGMPCTSIASSSSSSSSKKRGKSDVENKLGEFFMHQIANDASPAYGGGFRAANTAVNKYGLRRTLDHIQLTGHFLL